MVQTGWRKSGKYEAAIRAAFRAEGVPEDLLWLAMVESAFEPTVKSPVGAAGLFQFMPDGARQYGLRLDRWTDERRDPAKSASAAAKYLGDLYKRFGTWELALAAYNMGHGALLQAVRKYSTNDFWELARLEAGLPWETSLYVPKILALATVAKNPAAFGLATVGKEPALGAEPVSARGGIPLEIVAQAAGTTVDELTLLNPHLRTDRLPLAPRGPDGMGEFAVNVPRGKGSSCSQKLPSLAAKEPAFVEHTVRLGQSVASLASDLGIARAKIMAWNGLQSGELVKPGDVLVLPADGAKKVAATSEKPVVVVPAGVQALPGKMRVFYRVARGDALRTIATAFAVDEADLASWNVLDPVARLQDGMTLQIFVDKGHDLSRVVALREDDAQVLVVSSDEFFAYFEEKKGRRRVEVVCSEKDTWATVASRYKLSVALLERINRRSRSTPLAKGEKLVVYTGLAEKSPVFAREEAVTGKSTPVAPEGEPLREAVGREGEQARESRD
jgi:membrane-bound lytic murein transglycosylase D